jgi:hypothetical protein
MQFFLFLNLLDMILIRMPCTTPHPADPHLAASGPISRLLIKKPSLEDRLHEAFFIIFEIGI